MRHCAKVFIILLPVLAAFGQPSNKVILPPTPAGKHVEAYLRAFNSGEVAMREFFLNHTAKDELKQVPVEQRLARYRQMHERLGSLELRKVIESRDDHLTALFRSSNGSLVNLEFEFSPTPPYGFVSLHVEDVGEEGARGDPRKDNAELRDSVQSYLARNVNAGEFSGVVFIAQNGKPLFRKAYGLADRDHKIPNEEDTKFNIGSINKTFTALTVRQLAAEGRLSFSDPIKKFLPDYPNKEAAEKVTVQQLLDMTSGIGDIFGERYEKTPKEKLKNIRDYFALFADKPLEFQPGTNRRYSNGGYVVLGVIIEQVSGMDYYSYVREHIFKPAGMAETESFEKDVQIPNRAIGYTRDGKSMKQNYETLPGRGSSAGGGYSTAVDLFKFTVALKSGILTPGDKREAGGSEMIAGGAPGLNAALGWNLKGGYTIIVMSNLDPPSAERIAQQISRWLPK
jgi:CubicO group peptidase (beta-lactamase class C family)